MPGAAGTGPAAMPRDRGGVEEDAPRQEEAAEGQRRERKGKHTLRGSLMKVPRTKDKSNKE